MDNYNNGGSGGNMGPGGNGGNNQKPPRPSIMMILVFVLMSLLFVSMLWTIFFGKGGNVEEVPYSTFVERMEADQIESVKLSGETVSFTLKDGVEDSTPRLFDFYSMQPVKVEYQTLQIENTETVTQRALEHGVEVYGVSTSVGEWIMQILVTLVLPLILMWILLGFLFRRMGGSGGPMGVGKSNAKVYVQKETGVTFADVAGEDEAKESLVEVVDFLHNPGRYAKIGARLPKGALLVGPPGTGKTLLAKAVAGEAGAPFFSISGSDFVEMFVGVGASRVRDLFDQAKKHTPSIIFIDEIDAVGRQRGAGLGGGHDEREQTLNQLLVEMDGFTENENIIVMAATNRRDILDPALLRPGRFDRQIVVNYPDIKGREEILKVHTRNKNIGPDVDLKTIAASTAGFTGADLENLVNEAALLAARNNRKAVIKEDIEEATIKVVAGPEKKSRVISPEDKRVTAYHEAGHAVATMFCPTQDKVHMVSIIPRGMAAGFTMHLPEKDNGHVTKNRMEESIVVLLGGRAAEKIILDDITTGASNDIERATSVARDMVTRYGFSEKLGPILYGSENQEVFLGRDYSQGRNYSENVASEIDAEVRELIETGYEKAKDILTVHGDLLERCAQYLIRHEKIEGPDFYRLMANEIDLDGNEIAQETEKSDELLDGETTAETTEQTSETPEDNSDN